MTRKGKPTEVLGVDRTVLYPDGTQMNTRVKIHRTVPP